MGAGGGQAEAIVLKVPSPPPRGPPTPTGPPESLASANKGAATPRGRHDPFPPAQAFPASPEAWPAPPARVQPHPLQEDTAWTPLAQLDSEQHPGPALPQQRAGRLHPECRDRVWGGGLPLGAAEHAATGEGGHREIGKRCPKRVRHDPAAATWWQVRRRQQQREERASALGGGCSRCGGQGRAGEGRALLLLRLRLRPVARGRCGVSPSEAPPASTSGAPTWGSIPVHLSPKAHLLLFRGRGKSFWKKKG